MKYLKSLFLFTIFSFSFSATADYSILYDNCSDSKKRQLVSNFTNANISPAEAVQRVTKVVHIIDTRQKTVTSYDVWKDARYLSYLNPPTYAYVPGYKEVPTYSRFQSKAEQLFAEIKKMDYAMSSIKVPKEVIGGAWEFTNCAYCENEVRDWLVNTEKINEPFYLVQNTLSYLNIVNGTLNKVYVLTLESGGKITVKLQVVNEGEVAQIKVTKVVDAKNNTVPLKSGGLNNLILKPPMNHYYQDMQHYLWRFGYTIKETPAGTVAVTVCRPKGQPLP